MKRILLCAALFAASFTTVAQVGVGNTDPKATLDVTGDAADAASLDGIIAPRLTGAELRAKTYTADQLGAIVYATAADTAPAGQTVNVTEAGYYSFDGTEWVRFAAAVAPFEPALTVYVDTADPNSATKFDSDYVYYTYDDTTMGCIVNTNFVHDAALADDTNNLYVGHSGVCTDDSDGSEYSYWKFDGTDYVPFQASETTEWYLSPTKVDAGSNKTAGIKRDGVIAVGEGLNANDRFAIYAGHVTNKNPRSEALSGVSALGIYIANRHNGTNDLTGLYGLYNTNFNYSALDMATQYGLYSANNHYGTGRINTFRGINNTMTASADSGGFNTGYGLITSILNSSTSTDDIATFYGLTATATNKSPGRVTNARGAVFSYIANGDGGSFNSGYGIGNTLTNSSTSTDAIANMYGIYNDVNHNSPGLVASARGITSNYTADAASGGFTNGIGFTNTLTNSSTAAAVITGFTGINNDVNHSSAGSVSTGRGLTNNFTANAASGTVNNGMGIDNTYANNSPSTDAISIFYGIGSSLSSNNAGRINNIRGISNVANLTAASAGFNTGYGLYNYFNNSSASSDAISTMYGINNDVNHSSPGYVSNLRGLQSSATTVGASGSFNNGYGAYITLANNSDSTDTTNNSTGLYLANTQATGGFTTAQYGIYNLNYGGNAVTDGSVKNMYGTYTSTQLRTKNTAADANSILTGTFNSITQNSVVNTATLTGYDGNISVTDVGGVTTNLTGIDNRVSISSTSTDVLPTLRGMYTYNLFNSTQSVTNMYGTHTYNNISTLADGGHIDNLYGSYVYNYKHASSTSTLTNSYGFFYKNSNIVSESNYGLYLESITGGTTANYAIYSAGGDSYFTDSVRIGNVAQNGVITDGAVTPVPAGGAGTMAYYGGHFFGFNGTDWKQLDN
jgi:hypothetical protein